MTIKLTDRFLTSRKAPLKGRAIYTDSIVPGLTFRVSAATASNPSGRRDWLLRYRPRRQRQRAAGLGSYPAVSLAKARERAGEIIAAAKRGVDLIAIEECDAEARHAAEAEAQPLCEIANAYLARCAECADHPHTRPEAGAADDAESRSAAANHRSTRWRSRPDEA